MVSRGGQRVNELRLSLFISLAEQPDVHWIRFGIHLSDSSHQKAPRRESRPFGSKLLEKRDVV